MTETSAQLERRAEKTRERLTAELEALRSNVSVGQVVSDIFNIGPDGPGIDGVTRMLIKEFKANPIACTMIVTGIGLLLYPNVVRVGSGTRKRGSRKARSRKAVRGRK